MAYDNVEPFGDYREDLRAGMICSTIANFGPRKLKQPLKISDFQYLREPEETREQTPEDIKKILGGKKPPKPNEV